MHLTLTQDWLTCKFSYNIIQFFFSEGLVTNPAIWLVLYAVCIFLYFFFFFRGHGNESYNLIGSLCSLYFPLFFFFSEGMVTNPTIWLVLYLVSIFLSLPTGKLGTLSWVTEYIPTFNANSLYINLVFPARQYFWATTWVTTSSQ